MTDYRAEIPQHLERLTALMGSDALCIWVAPYALDELYTAGKYEAIVYRLQTKVWELEESDETA